MAHVSLYRKYRSQTFAEIVGQKHITTTLANAVSDGKLHHAYLFTGPRGTGKTSTARILAKAVDCVEGPTATPCNACEQCTAISAGSSIDVIEIDAASHGGVDDVRDLRERVAFAPASARMKVYIVDECHMLSTAGWNAFLKTVEEPPGHVLFVFATTEPHKVLPTILSRTQRFDFRRIPAADLAAHCGHVAAAEGITLEPGALDVIVRAGDGSARDALSVLEQVVAFTGPQVTLRGVVDVLGSVSEDRLLELGDLLASGDVPGLMRLVGQLADGGQDLRQLTRDAVEHLRRLFLARTAPDAGLVEGTPEQLARLRDQAGRLGSTELLRAVELLAEAQVQMRRGHVRLPLEIALCKAALPEACGDPAALAARMDRLERRTGLEARPEAVDPGAAHTPAPSADPEPVAPAASAPEQVASPRADAEVPARPPAPETPAGSLTQTQPAAVEAVDSDLVRRSWPAVLEHAKDASRRFHALLSQGQPTEVRNGELVVSFGASYGYHAEQVGGEWRDTLSEVLDQVLGVALRVRCVVVDGIGGQAEPVEHDPAADREVADVVDAEAAEAAGELQDDEQAHDEALETVKRVLDARELDE